MPGSFEDDPELDTAPEADVINLALYRIEKGVPPHAIFREDTPEPQVWTELDEAIYLNFGKNHLRRLRGHRAYNHFKHSR